jgi:hypothetical protein
LKKPERRSTRQLADTQRRQESTGHASQKRGAAVDRHPAKRPKVDYSTLVQNRIHGREAVKDFMVIVTSFRSFIAEEQR